MISQESYHKVLSACGATGHTAAAKLMQGQTYGKGVAGIHRQEDFLVQLSFFPRGDGEMQAFIVAPRSYKLSTVQIQNEQIASNLKRKLVSRPLVGMPNDFWKPFYKMLCRLRLLSKARPKRDAKGKRMKGSKCKCKVIKGINFSFAQLQLNIEHH